MFICVYAHYNHITIICISVALAAGQQYFTPGKAAKKGPLNAFLDFNRYLSILALKGPKIGFIRGPPLFLRPFLHCL